MRSLVSICPVGCFTLFLYLISVTFLCALLFGVLDICVCLCWSAVFVYLIFMYNKVLFDIYVRSMLYAYCCTHQKSSIQYNFCTRYYSSKVMRYKALCFGTRYRCCLGAVAPLLLLLLSTVICVRVLLL